MSTASSEMRVDSCVEPRRSQTIGTGPREVRLFFFSQVVFLKFVVFFLKFVFFKFLFFQIHFQFLEFFLDFLFF